MRIYCMKICGHVCCENIRIIPQKIVSEMIFYISRCICSIVLTVGV